MPCTADGKSFALVKRRLIPDDLNASTTFRYTPAEAATWGKARLTAWENLHISVRNLCARLGAAPLVAWA
eukprot:scaffold308338_cov31-Tisochrysis_lutea.AAC.1